MYLLTNNITLNTISNIVKVLCTKLTIFSLYGLFRVFFRSHVENYNFHRKTKFPAVFRPYKASVALTFA